MGQKIKLTLGLKVGLIIVLGTIIVSMTSFIYTTHVFQQVVKREFHEKIVSAAEATSYMCSPIAVGLAELQKEKARPKKSKKLATVLPEKIALLRELTTILEASVTREDMLYAALVMDGRVISKLNAAGRSDFKLPERKETKETILGYFVRDIKYDGVKGREINVPIEYMGSDIAELLVGFDQATMLKEIAGLRQNSLMISLIGMTALSLLLLVYLQLFVIIPVKRISVSAHEMGSGRKGNLVQEVKTGDEIETLVTSFNEMSEYFTRITGASKEIAQGIIPLSFQTKSMDDDIGQSISSMIDYLKIIAFTLNRVASGDISFEHKAKSPKDELGRSIEEMLKGLRGLVTGIKEKADIVAFSSENLAKIAEQSQQTIIQMTETISSISTATSDAATTSQHAATAAMNAEKEAKQGQGQMHKLNEKMQAVKSDILKSNAVMQKLSEHSQEIKAMVDIIHAIADETKLLSFNAAIEAARAGESGRGFVVVAEEIRKLSDMSTEQAKRIAELIKEVRKDIGEAAEISTRQTEGINEGSVLAGETDRTFGHIVKTVDEAAAQVENIAASSQQIAASSQEAAASSEQQSSAMEELSASTVELSDTAKHLKEAADRFDV